MQIFLLKICDPTFFRRRFQIYGAKMVLPSKFLKLWAFFHGDDPLTKKKTFALVKDLIRTKNNGTFCLSSRQPE